MGIEQPTALLRIYLGESDHARGAPTHHRIVEHLRERGLAGATVLRGIEGYGAKQHLHTDRILSLSGDLPIVIEIVDAEEKIAAFLPAVDALVSEGLVTIEDVRVLKYASPDHR